MHTSTLRRPYPQTGWRRGLLAGLLALATAGAQAQTFQVTSSTPAAHAASASRTAPVELQFSQAVDPATLSGITVFASSKHAINTKGMGASVGRVIVTPANPLRAGEEVRITVPASVRPSGTFNGGILPIVVPYRAAAGGTSTQRLATRYQASQHLSDLADATLADVDNDGDLDALALDPVLGQVNVLLNDGTGALLTSTPRRRGVSINASVIECADLDNDGDLDLLGLRGSSSAGQSGVFVCRNDGTGTFGAPSPVGNNWVNATALCTGDFDSDGDLDVAVADAGASTVVVCRNNSGAFQPTGFTNVACTGFPAALTCTDVDNDGDLDLLASCRDTGEIAILLWQISQWTALRVALPTGNSHPSGLCTGDLNGDGKVETVISCAGTPGTGSTGTPSVPSSVIVMTRCPPPNEHLWCFYNVKDPSPPRQTNVSNRPALADLDGDGDLDVLCPNGASGVVVCRNTGTGTFTDGDANPYRSSGDKLYCWGQTATSVCAGDLDNDGDMDAIAVCTGSGDITSMMNQEPVRLTQVSPPNNALVSRSFTDVQVLHSTPLAASSSQPTLRVHCGVRGRFQSVVAKVFVPSNARSLGYTWTNNFVAPFTLSTTGATTADGRTAPPVSWRVDRRPDPSDGTLAVVGGTPLALGAGSVSCAGDFDLDGVQDVLSVSSTGVKFDFKPQRGVPTTTGTGGFGWTPLTASSDLTAPAGYLPVFVRCADMDNDGDPDAVVVATNGTDSYCAIYTCDAATQVFTKATGDYLTGLVTDLIVTDLENDGDLEALMAIPGSLSCARKGIKEKGIKVFDTPEAMQTLAFAPSGPGEENKVCAATGPTRVRFTATPYDAAGEAHFESTPTTLPAAAGQNLTVADLDGDGVAEVIVPLPSANAFRVKVTVPAGTATGSKDYTVTTGTGSGPTRTYAADLDGDGDRDVVAICPGNNTVWVGLNDGTGAFASSSVVTVNVYNSAPVEAWTGDCDNDGIADVLVRCADNTVRLLECGPPAANDLFITTTQTVPAGTYHNITVLDGGDATLSAGITCTGRCTVANGGVLRGGLLLPNIQSLVLSSGSTVHIADPNGISADGSSGAYRVVASGCCRPSALFVSYVYDGTTPQTTGTGLPPQVYELTVANPTGLSLSSPTTITGRIVVKPGCILRPPTPATALRIRSSADSTAVVVNEGTGVIQGNVIVETWVASHTTPGAYGYRHLTSPTSNATVASLAAPGYTPTCSAVFNTSPAPASVQPFPSVMYYDETRQLTAVNNLSTFDKGWTAPTALTDALPVGRGIASNMPGDRRITFTGPLNNGDYTINLTRNAGSSTGNAASGGWAGWALVGNPYPSPLDWSLVPATDRPGLDAAIYAFENNSQYTGRYLSYTNGLGDLNPVLAMSQGFWVRVSAGQTTGSLTVKNPSRSTGMSAGKVSLQDLHRGTTARPTLRLALRPEASPGLLDNLYLYVEAGASTALDAQYDAVKMPNSTGLNLSATASTGEALAIQGLAALGNGTTVVPLVLGLPVAGRYELAVGALADFTPGTRLVLRDQLLNTSTQLTSTTRYTFASTATTVSGRFFLELSANGALASAGQLLAAGVSLYPNPAAGEVTVQVPAVIGTAAATLTLTDALGRTVRTVTAALPADGLRYTLPLTGLAPGVYALRVTAGAAVAVRRLVVE